MAQNDPYPYDSEFDLRVRAELALALEPGEAPADLLRHTPLLSRRGVLGGAGALLLLGTGAGGVLAVRPPELVRGAIEHEYYERTLLGASSGAGCANHGPTCRAINLLIA